MGRKLRKINKGLKTKIRKLEHVRGRFDPVMNHEFFVQIPREVMESDGIEKMTASAQRRLWRMAKKEIPIYWWKKLAIYIYKHDYHYYNYISFIFICCHPNYIKIDPRILQDSERPIIWRNKVVEELADERKRKG